MILGVDIRGIVNFWGNWVIQIDMDNSTFLEIKVCGGMITLC